MKKPKTVEIPNNEIKPSFIKDYIDEIVNGENVLHIIWEKDRQSRLLQKDTAHCAGIFFNPENTEILYKSHFAKRGYEVIIFISICFLLLPSYADANGYIANA